MSYKTENVDISFEMINEAVEEFNGFLLGIPEGDIYQILLNNLSSSNDENSSKNLREIRKVLSNILDRTNGGTSLNNMGALDNNKFKDVGVDSEGIITISHADSIFGISSDHYDSGPGRDEIQEYAKDEMKTVLKYVNPGQFRSRTIESTSLETRSILGTELTNPVLDQIVPAGFNSNISTAPGILGFHKIDSPSMGAVIIKDPIFGFNSRNANHMPIFLGAITPLEMSKCTPYLNIQIITKKRGQSSFSKLGIHNFLRYESPVRNEQQPVLFEDMKSSGQAFNEVISDHFNFMDVFTSPQTMVNPNTNKKSIFSINNAKDSFKNLKERSNKFEFEDVKDPFQPFMTLLSFNASIAGIGHGLLATKKASLKIKLHDKSRIKDLAPFLSPNEFSSTKFVIEYGWSHPDGSVDSNNTLGKYLNALRDLSVYQLVNADYSFGNDNSVDITINLVCSGFQQMKTISAAGGIYTNLSAVIDEIQEDIEFSFNDKDSVLGGLVADSYGLERLKKVKEIRGQLKISNDDLSKNSTLVKFEDLKSFKNSINNSDNADDIIKKFIQLIYHIPEGDVNIINLMDAIKSNDKDTINRIIAQYDSDIPNAGDIIYAKFRSLNLGIDPFRAQTVRSFYETALEGNNIVSNKKKVYEVPLIGINKKYPESSTSDHVSLGKIISMFIGYPMSTCGLYDEVQLFFYPVNSQSAGARKHTTASLPINMKDLEIEINKRTKSGEQSFRNLSVHGFFAMLERIVSNQNITAYDLFNETSSLERDLTPLEAFRKKSFEDKYLEATSSESFDINSINEQVQADVASQTLDEKSIEDLRKSKIIETYETILSKIVGDARKERLREIYDKEDDYFSEYYIDKEKFTPINLSMFFETFSPRNKNNGGSENFLEDVLSLVDITNPIKRRDTIDNGKDVEKTILRIHIYDENGNMSPDISLYGSNTVNMSKLAKASKENLNSYSFIKNLLMKRHPSIIHGASSGVVNNINISSNTSGQLSNVLMVEAYEKSINAGSSDTGEPSGFDEVILLPTTVNLELMGFPMLARGQQIFIDFGTQTSLDNLYTVKSVDHTLQAGSFVTSAILVASNQMIVSSFRSSLESLLKIMNVGEE
jgi:hypothetical protein